MNLCKRDIVEDIAGIVIVDMQGEDRKEKIFPLTIKDLGEIWLVKGSPYENEFLNTHYNTFFMHMRKDTCEILDIGTQGRIKLDADSERDYRQKFSPEQYEAVFGVPTNFDVDPVTLDLAYATSGGVINSSQTALAFARTILKANASGSLWAGQTLRAIEVSHIWHIQGALSQSESKVSYRDILIFNRGNAKILSFNP